MKKQDSPKIGKGLIEQIEERGVFKPLSREELEEGLKTLMENERKARIVREKKRKADQKHLIERAKELGKPIPSILAYYSVSGNTWWASQEQLKEYREWFQPTQKEIEREYINFKMKENAK